MEEFRKEFFRYLSMVMKKRYLFVAVAVVLMTAVIIVSYMMPEKYEAKSTVFIERNVIERLVKGIAITPSMQDRIRILRETMLGRSLVLKVIRKLDLDNDVNSDAELEMLIMRYQNKTNIRVSKNNLIRVSFVSKDPALARDYINTLVNVYVENNIFAKKAEAYDANKFLGKQVEFFKTKMDEGEDAVIKFRQEQGIFVALDEASVINEIKRYRSEIEQIKIRINELEASKKSLDSQLKGEKPYNITVFNTKSTADTIKALETRLRQLLITYTENYPEVVKIRSEIEALRKGQQQEPVQYLESPSESGINPVYQEIKQKIMETEAEIQALNAKERHLKSLIQQKERELREIPESRKKLADLLKERDTYKKVYEQLLVRLGQSEVSKQMEIEDKATTFRIIEPAILPTIPVSPNRPLMILLAVAIGIAGAFVLVFVLDYIDNSVKSIDSLKELGLPVLAVIPVIRTDDEIATLRKKDRLLYGFAGLYMGGVAVLWVFETLGIF
jgi:polysaccharide chain length determinant protein (PEP-CTERM system associated)